MHPAYEDQTHYSLLTTHPLSGVISQVEFHPAYEDQTHYSLLISCLLYTSDAADDRSSVDFDGSRIIKKKQHR
mgnify:CR=1 FL=1